MGINNQEELESEYGDVEKGLAHTEGICSIHGKNCPGDDGGFLIDGNHPDDMFSLGPVPTKRKRESNARHRSPQR